MDSVAIVKYEGDLMTTLREGIELIGGLESLQSPFIIKPNICAGQDSTGFAVTNVEVVEALIQIVLEKNRRLSIKIVESDSGSKYADEAFKAFGYTHLEADMKQLNFDVSLINLSRAPTTQLKFKGLHFMDPRLPTLLLEPSFFVSLAVAKTHGLAFITGTLKNLFGLLPRKDQFVYHPYINEVIIDLNRLISPDLCIVDARVGLEGWAGPRMRRLNVFIIGRNPVAVDSTMAQVMGFNPEKIPQLMEAEQMGLGSLHPKVLGASVASVKVPFNPPHV